MIGFYSHILTKPWFLMYSKWCSNYITLLEYIDCGLAEDEKEYLFRNVRGYRKIQEDTGRYRGKNQKITAPKSTTTDLPQLCPVTYQFLFISMGL